MLRQDATMTTVDMVNKLSVNRRIVQRGLEKLKKKNVLNEKTTGVAVIGKCMNKM